MHSYVVVAAKPGRVIPPHVTELLEATAPVDVPFVPSTHLSWADRRGALAYGGWQAPDESVELGSHWQVDTVGITAFSGRMWPHGGMWQRGRSWAEQLSERWRRQPIEKVGQPFDGLFTAVSLSADGMGEMITDPLSLAMIYRAENSDLVAYSTRPGLAAWATAREGACPPRDPFGSGWMIFAGDLFGDRTGFEGVRALPIGSYVEFHPRFGSRVRTSDPTPWANTDGLPEDSPSLVAIVHDDLANRVESITRLESAGGVRADLTGGRDSRLVLALLLEGGLAGGVRFNTIGGDTTPDAIVGRELAEMFRLTHTGEAPVISATASSPTAEPAPRSEVTPSFLRRLQVHSFQTSGMANAWDLTGGTGASRAVRISGLFGETFRTHFSAWPPLEESESLWRMYLDRTQADRLGILVPDARGRYHDLLREELAERWDSESSLPLDRLDTFFIRNRLRRWSGTHQEIGHSGNVFPLYSLLATKAAFILGPQRRRDDYLSFHIMRKACPSLAEHRFAERGWRDSVLETVSDADRYRAEPCTGVAEADARPSPGPWQADRIARHRDVFEAYLLDPSESQLFDIVDRNALTRALRKELPPGPSARYQIFGALAAAVWLGRHESAIRVGTPLGELPSARPLPPRTPRRVHDQEVGVSLRRRLVRHLPRRVRRSLLGVVRRS